MALVLGSSSLKLRVRAPSTCDDSMARSGITRGGMVLPSFWDGRAAGLGPNCLVMGKEGIELPSGWDGMASGLGLGTSGGVNEEAHGYKLLHIFSGLLQTF